MKLLRPACLLLLALLAGCAGAAAERSPRPDRNLLTAEEMQSRPYSSLHHAVAALRANWVRERPPSDHRGVAPERAQVFLDGLRVGDVEYLRQLQVGDVESVRYLSITEAATRFGHQADAGPILLITLKQGT